MVDRRIELIEHRDTDQSRPLVEGTPELASSTGNWSGLPFELLNTEDQGELRHFECQHSMATICLGGHQQIDVRMGAARYDALMTPGRVSVGAGGREITRCTWRGSQRMLVVELSDDVLSAMLGNDFVKQTFELDERFGVADAPLVALGEAMRLEVEAGCPSGSLYAQSLSLAFALQLRRRTDINLAGGKPAPSEGSGLSAKHIALVFEYIDAHLARPLALDDLAKITGLSVPHFARLFKRATGLTPYRHVLERRIECAATMLRGESDSIADIALATGFADQSHFTCAFRKATGLTPARFRRRELVT